MRTLCLSLVSLTLALAGCSNRCTGALVACNQPHPYECPCLAPDMGTTPVDAFVEQDSGAAVEDSGTTNDTGATDDTGASDGGATDDTGTDAG